ncbi:hypothetical protein JXI42_12250 [bacterium]|nr:hypothetical protein [bacterium]
MKTQHQVDKKYKWIRTIGRIICLVWLGWWIMFAVFVIIMDGFNSSIVFYPISIAFLFMVTSIIAYRNEELGGIILLLEGCFISIAYPVISRNMPLTSIIYILGTMGFPPLIAGSLLMIHHFQCNNLGINSKRDSENEE